MKPMQLMMITPVPEIAARAEKAGVGRIFIDMETIGKKERQANANTPIYAHTFEEARRVKAALTRAEMMIRINPLHDGTRSEVDRSIDAGADCIMLPYFRYSEEVREFFDIVDGRVKTCLLFESSEAIGRARQILEVPGIQEVHFGLNDFRISLGLDFLFESFAGGVIDWLCEMARERGYSYGIGGIGRMGKELLPAELILREHVRLRSERVILSRVFHGEAKTITELDAYVNIEEEIHKLRREEAAAWDRSAEQEEKDRVAFCQGVKLVADRIRANAKKPA